MENVLKEQFDNISNKAIDILPNNTLYVNNLNEKLKADGIYIILQLFQNLSKIFSRYFLNLGISWKSTQENPSK
jgi:hypothetical protein